jgi:hypothetical protein
VAVDPNMIGAGPMIPPQPGNTLGMNLPSMPMQQMPAPGSPPAVEALPGIAQLAQEQTMQVLEQERQMMEMQERMQKEIMLLIASLPTKNPAGQAAVSTPLPPAMSGAGMGAPSAPMGMSGMGDEMMPSAPMGGELGGY